MDLLACGSPVTPLPAGHSHLNPLYCNLNPFSREICWPSVCFQNPLRNLKASILGGHPGHEHSQQPLEKRWTEAWPRGSTACLDRSPQVPGQRGSSTCQADPGPCLEERALQDVDGRATSWRGCGCLYQREPDGSNTSRGVPELGERGDGAIQDQCSLKLRADHSQPYEVLLPPSRILDTGLCLLRLPEEGPVTAGEVIPDGCCRPRACRRQCRVAGVTQA